MLKKIKAMIILLIKGIRVFQQEGPRLFMIKLKRFFLKEKFKEIQTILKKDVESILKHDEDEILTLYDPQNITRINLVLESWNECHEKLTDDMIFSVQLANKLEAPIRFITKDFFLQEATLYKLLKGCFPSFSYNNFDFYNIPKAKESNFRMPVIRKDIFISNCLWATELIKKISLYNQYISFFTEPCVNSISKREVSVTDKDLMKTIEQLNYSTKEFTV